MQNNQKSIHIVIFTGGLAPEPQKTREFWACKGHPDFVIAADSGLDTLVKYNDFFADIDFSPCSILGDFDSISSKSLPDSFPQADVQVFPKDKDFTDTELAVLEAGQIAEGKGGAFVTLVGGGGGRVDHLLQIFTLYEKKMAPDAWLCEEQILYKLKKNTGYTLFNLKKEDCLSFINFRNRKAKILTKGLQWEGNLFFKSFVQSLSNRISDDNIALKKEVLLKPKSDGYILAVPYSVRFRQKEY